LWNGSTSTSRSVTTIVLIAVVAGKVILLDAKLALDRSQAFDPAGDGHGLTRFRLASHLAAQDDCGLAIGIDLDMSQAAAILIFMICPSVSDAE